jgi:hypothetical protein
MMDICRRILCIGLASLVLMGLSGVSLAGPDEGQGNVPSNVPSNELVNSQGQGMMPPQNGGLTNGPHAAGQDHNIDGNMMKPDDMMGQMGHQDDAAMQSRNEGFPMGIPLEVLYSGHGFALMDNESHILRLKVENIMPMQPDQIRDIFSSNKSLEEIRDEIRAKEDNEQEMAVRGSMILDRGIYPLVNIAISTTSNNTTTIRAGLADRDQQPSNGTSTWGSLSVVISPSEGGMIGNGELDIKKGQNIGRYSILLDLEPPRDGHDKSMRED